MHTRVRYVCLCGGPEDKASPETSIRTYFTSSGYICMRVLVAVLVTAGCLV